MRIDLNCDMGELPSIREADIMPYITSANIACGGHAGDRTTMEATLRLAMAHGVCCGAHPSYPDRANFGREAMSLTPGEIAHTVFEQVTALDAVARNFGVRLVHVKPHGALYNVGARNPDVARAIADGVARWRTDVVLVGLAGSQMLDTWSQAGFQTAAEAFADRTYEPDGGLRSRKLPGAMIDDPETAAAQALMLARDGGVQTICIHSDTLGAPAIIRAVRSRLEAEGIIVSALAKRLAR